MSQNVEALRAIYAEWGRGNWKPRFEVYDDEMEWGWSSEFPSAGVTRDPVERSSRLREWLSPWEDWRCEAEDYLQHGDYVVALTRYRGRGKGSGATVDTRGAHVWKFRDGKVIRLEVFADRERAIESIGVEAVELD
jgi:ketosteroid isomerase-like protein